MVPLPLSTEQLISRPQPQCTAHKGGTAKLSRSLSCQTIPTNEGPRAALARAVSYR
jgi:hypothetical protein